jgi:hypothetical protein
MDPSKGVVRWAARRARGHLQAVIPSAVFIPLISAVAGFYIALPKHPTNEQRVIQASKALVVGLLIVATLAFLYAVLVAPYEQRRLLRLSLAETERKYRELLNGVHKSIVLAQLRIRRDVLPQDTSLTCGLHFTLEFRNDAPVPIEYSMKRMFLKFRDTENEVPVDADASYRIASDKTDAYLFSVGLNPPVSGGFEGKLTYAVRYGPTTAPEYYEQNYEYVFQDASNVSGTTYLGRYWRSAGGHDIIVNPGRMSRSL